MNVGGQLKIAIELGQVWMKKSLNHSHDWTHAQNVATHSLKIYESLKKEGRMSSEITPELVEISAWWHDSYKSRLRRTPVTALFNEGFESEKIVRLELAKFLSKKQLDLVSHAIRHHHFPAQFFFLFRYFYTPLMQILFEADHLEVFRMDRFRWLDNPLLTVLFKIYLFRVRVLLGLLPNSEYTKRYISKLKV